MCVYGRNNDCCMSCLCLLLHRTTDIQEKIYFLRISTCTQIHSYMCTSKLKNYTMYSQPVTFHMCHISMLNWYPHLYISTKSNKKKQQKRHECYLGVRHNVWDLRPTIHTLVCECLKMYIIAQQSV